LVCTDATGRRPELGPERHPGALPGEEATRAGFGKVTDRQIATGSSYGKPRGDPFSPKPTNFFCSGQPAIVDGGRHSWKYLNTLGKYRDFFNEAFF
jgi:hypothetical protein